MSNVSNTDEAKQSAKYDFYRGRSEIDLKSDFSKIWPSLENEIKIKQDKEEVALKLREIGVYGIFIDTIIGKLVEANYLNETRFAESFVRGKFRIKKWGKKRLIRELKIRDISDWNIKNALKEISDPEYFDCCKALVKKFWVSNENKSLIVRRKKIWAALQYRGWETELIMENILSLESQKE